MLLTVTITVESVTVATMAAESTYSVNGRGKGQEIRGFREMTGNSETDIPAAARCGGGNAAAGLRFPLDSMFRGTNVPRKALAR